MRNNQTVFSMGDLCGTMAEEYRIFIEYEYNGNYSDRLSDIENMITRLEFEKKQIKKRLSGEEKWRI